MLSEGAAVVLEDLDVALDRGVRPYGEVLGYASASESGTEGYSAALEEAIRTDRLLTSS